MSKLKCDERKNTCRLPNNLHHNFPISSNKYKLSSFEILPNFHLIFYSVPKKTSVLYKYALYMETSIF
jgi:hypothetical protein